MTTIGDKIKERRIELGMTQEDLANKMGYKSKSSINKIELGLNDIPQSKIIEFAKALDTTIQYLMNWEEEVNEVNEIKEHNNAVTAIIVRLNEDKDFLEVVEMLNNADRKHLKKYKAMLNVLLQESEY